MSNEKPQFNKSELLAELTNKHTAETSAKLDTLKKAGIETVTQLEKVQQVIKDIKMPKNLKVELEGAEIVTIKGQKGDVGDVGPAGKDGKSIVGPQGPKGDSIQGPHGKDGKDGKNGKNAKPPTAIELKSLIKPLIPDPIPGAPGIDGQDGSPDTPIEIRDKLKTLKGEERLDASAIKNLPRGKGGKLLIGGPPSAKKFTELDDVPNNYTGQESKIVKVKSTGDGLEFGSAGHTIQDEGTSLTARTNLNFVGTGVAVTDDSVNNQTDVTISGAHTVQNAGTSLTQRTNLNISTGLTATDDAANDQSDITLNLTNVNAWTGQQYFAEATLTDGATISWNVNTQQTAKVTLAGNRTMAAPTNLVAGGTYILRVIQDGTGSRTITWNAVFKWPAGTAPTLTTTASAVDIITFVSDGTNMNGVAQLKFS